MDTFSGGAAFDAVSPFRFKASEPQIQDVTYRWLEADSYDRSDGAANGCLHQKSYIQELEKSGARKLWFFFLIVLLPKKYLTEGQALTLDGKYLYNGSVYKPAKVPAVKKFSEDNDRIYFTAFWQICRKKDIKMITRRELMQKSREL